MIAACTALCTGLGLGCQMAARLSLEDRSVHDAIEQYSAAQSDQLGDVERAQTEAQPAWSTSDALAGLRLQCLTLHSGHVPRQPGRESRAGAARDIRR